MYLQNTALTHSALPLRSSKDLTAEKVIVLTSSGKVINEEVGIRMFSLSQMTKVKLVCALAWRENFAKGNNSVTDTKRRMHDSPTLRQSTSWPSDGEGHVRWQRIIPLSERSMVNEECPSTSKGTMQWKSKTEERKKRLEMFGYKLSC